MYQRLCVRLSFTALIFTPVFAHMPHPIPVRSQELVHAIGQWLGPVDEASNEVYYVNTISGMSMWEKPTELLTAESAMRNLCVTLIEKEMKGERRMRQGVCAVFFV